MKRVTLVACGLALCAMPALAAPQTDDRFAPFVVAENKHGQTNPNRNPNRNPNKKDKSNVDVSVSNRGASVGVHNNGTSVRVGPSGPSISTRTDSGVRIGVGSNGRFRIGF